MVKWPMGDDECAQWPMVAKPEETGPRSGRWGVVWGPEFGRPIPVT